VGCKEFVLLFVCQDLSLVDAGTYTCTATNRLGYIEAVGTLLVRSTYRTTERLTRLHPGQTTAAWLIDKAYYYYWLIIWTQKIDGVKMAADVDLITPSAYNILGAGFMYRSCWVKLCSLN